MKKRFLTFAAVIFLAAIFTSCVDVVQVVSFENGKYKFDYRVTVSKIVLALAQTDANGLFDEFDLNEIPEGFKIEQIDTETDLGIAIKAFIDPKTSDADLQKLLPTVLKNGTIRIPLFGSDEISEGLKSDSNDEYAQIAQAFFASAKWRAYVSKGVVSSISSAALRNFDGTYPLEFYEVGGAYCIEVPLLCLATGVCVEIKK